MAFDPGGVFTAIGDVALMVTKTLPSDEQKLAQFKLRSPKKYARIQKHMLNGFIADCRKKYFNPNLLRTYGVEQTKKYASDYVRLETDDLPESEQNLFIELTLAQLIN